MPDRTTFQKFSQPLCSQVYSLGLGMGSDVSPLRSLGNRVIARRRANHFALSEVNSAYVKASVQKYSSSVFRKCMVVSRPSRLRSRGALRDRHERWRRDAMDASARETNAFDADGQAVWSCPPDAGVKPCETIVARRRWLTSPVHRGERGAAVNTIARGMPVVSA